MTAYDEVPYTGRAYPDSHPDNLAAVATLFGMTPAPIGHCRVLEIACGDGANLIPMAHGLPGSRFVGFDLAATAIETGRRFAARLGLTNLSLQSQDLGDFPADAGQFDYIIAHGLYSWVPAAVRDRLMQLIAAHLAPNGVAFVSYNTYPGCYQRRMLWEILRFHTDHLADPQARLAEARALAGLMGRNETVMDAWGKTLRTDLERLAQGVTAHALHDDLSPVNEPVYFHQFVEHAGRHGLRFLAEAEFKAMGHAGLAAEVRQLLDGLDLLTREQYLDFFRLRRFRQTLLCHADVPLEHRVTPERIADFLLSTPAGKRIQLSGAGDAADGGPGGGAPSVEESLLQAALDELNAASPVRISFPDLLARLRRRPEAGLPDQLGELRLRELVFGAARAGAVSLHLSNPALVLEPGPRPEASPVARLQLAAGDIVTSLCHDAVKLDDAPARRLVGLLDGTRGRDDLARELGDLLDADQAESRHAALEQRLAHLGKLALLVA
jgi:SAM-dependent methyltransferase